MGKSQEELNSLEEKVSMMKDQVVYLEHDILMKKKELERLEAILEDREHRLQKLKNFIRHIYEMDV